jgi:hypothetical protein
LKQDKQFLTVLSPVTTKRIVLYRFDRQPLEGFGGVGPFAPGMEIELMSISGNLQVVAFAEVKAMCFVSEAGQADLFTEHTLFARRPKQPGLWTRFTFRDGDQLDGLLSHNLLEWPEAGYSAVPPRAGATRQRVFIPRLAVTGTELRGVVGKSTPAKRQGRKRMVQGDANQLIMFEP